MRRRQSLLACVLAGLGCGEGIGGAALDGLPRDAGGDADASLFGDGACVPVRATPDVDPWSVRLPSAGFGGIAMQAANGHRDLFLRSPSGTIRVGARLDWGGAIVFFGLSAAPGSNTIDANDTGRELQIALYDPTRAFQPCAATASCLAAPASCGNSITFLGWDPVQGGDECGHGGAVSAAGQAGDALQLAVTPLQWNPDWDRTDCAQTPCGSAGRPVQVSYTIELRFVHENVVEVMTQVVSQESFDHPPAGQEFPTLYVSHGQGGPDLPLLLDAAGQAVAIDMPGNDGFLYGNFVSPAPWVSWQNAQRSYGVGLAQDQGLTAFQGWRGDGQRAPYFHNVRAQVGFGLPAGGVVRGLSYLALGSFQTVAGLFGDLLRRRPPFGVVDLPRAGATAHYAPEQPLLVAGWVLDTAHVASVRAEIDGVLAATLPVIEVRPDVCAVYPGYDACPNVGYAAPVPTLGLPACEHLLRVRAIDADGNATTLGERVIAPQ